MDSWSNEQLKKMQAGGNGKLNAFLALYGVDKYTDITAKYNSKAAEVSIRWPCNESIVATTAIVFSVSSRMSVNAVVSRQTLHQSTAPATAHSCARLLHVLMQFLREMVKAEVEGRPYNPPPPSAVPPPSTSSNHQRGASGSARVSAAQIGDGGSMMMEIIPTVSSFRYS